MNCKNRYLHFRLRVFRRYLHFGPRLQNLTEATHVPQNFPALRAGIPPETEYKAPNFPALRAGTLQMVRKGPKFSGATRRETHHQISPHILNMCLQPCLPAWPDTRDVPPPTMPPTIPLTATAPGTLANEAERRSKRPQRRPAPSPTRVRRPLFRARLFPRVFHVYFTSHTYTATTPRCASWRVCRGSAIVKKTRNKYSEVLFR